MHKALYQLDNVPRAAGSFDNDAPLAARLLCRPVDVVHAEQIVVQPPVIPHNVL
jgi:hypothetical protein